MRLLKYLFSAGMAIAFLTGCSDLESEYGNSRIYFPNQEMALSLKDAVHTSSELAALPDSTINFITVYRSGMTSSLEEIRVRIELVQDEVANLITEAVQTEESDRTDEQKRYVEALPLPSEMVSIPSEVTIPNGSRSVIVPVVLKMGAIKDYRNDYLNYPAEDFENATKSKMLLMGIRIKETSGFDILQENSRCLLEITKCLTQL